MVCPPGNEGSDGPQLTSPLPRVAPTPDPRGGVPTGTAHDRQDDGAWRVWEWLRAFDRRLRRTRRPRPGRGALRAVLGLARQEPGTAAEPLVRRRADPPAGLPAPGAHGRVPRHRRRGLVQWLVTGPGLADVALLVALYTVALESEWRRRRGGRRHPRNRGRDGHRALGAGARTTSSPSSSSRGWSSPRCWPGWWCARCAASSTGWPNGPQRLELERDQQASLAAAAERARIAREMHDVVSHNIQVMVTLADAAVHGAGRRPGPGGRGDARGLEHRTPGLDRHATDARRPARRAGARQRGAPPPATGSATAGAARPSRGSASSTALVERVRGTGLDVTVRPVGVPFELSGAAGLTVYRVVQEALTNALKHAEEARVGRGVSWPSPTPT